MLGLWPSPGLPDPPIPQLKVSPPFGKIETKTENMLGYLNWNTVPCLLWIIEWEPNYG